MPLAELPVWVPDGISRESYPTKEETYDVYMWYILILMYFPKISLSV